MAELEQQLTALASAIDWPQTPDLSGRVLPAISLPARPAKKRWGLPRRWAIAAAAAVLVALALLAYPPSREAIAGWIDLHTTILRVPALATPSLRPPGPIGTRLGLGGQTTLEAAQRQVFWHIELPASLGTPDEVYLQPPPDGPSQGEVTLVYRSRPGIAVAGQTGVAVLVTEARGAVDEVFFGKILAPGTTIEPVSVSGHQGWWIEGAPHEFFFTDADGGFRAETLRLAGNTLILDEGGTVTRIEGNLTKAQALQIAAALG